MLAQNLGAVMSVAVLLKRVGVFAAAMLLASAAFGSASAYTLKTLHVFCAKTHCPDGWSPFGAPVPNGQGDFFGVTQLGGNGQNAGTIYALSPKKKKSGKWRFRTVYDFCSQASCADGRQPQGMLVADVHGNLYGTTTAGGKYNKGAVFEFTPTSKKSGTLKILYSFCAEEQCPDGYSPSARLTYSGAVSGALYDGVSPLYGVAVIEGPNGFSGLVYRLTPGTSWSETVLYQFCKVSGCPDGEIPAGVVLGTNGNLYGEATGEGTANAANMGTVFELSPAGGTWSETTLYQFCPHGQSGCTNGVPGQGPLVMDTAGNLYDGGADGVKSTNCTETYGCGVIFKVAPNGVNSTESVLYNFCGQPNCTDGSGPPTLVLDSASNIFGETWYGGGNDGDMYGDGGGTIFKFTGGTVQTLYAFCAKAGCADGAYPSHGLTIDATGTIFGATGSGGIGSYGTLFALEP
jgi:uncharacterized repeat protein (TIGR03803 family)